MVEGLEQFKQNMEQLIHTDLKKPTMAAVLLVQEAAKSGVLSKTGKLRNSIYTSVRSTEDGIEGICYTNEKYAQYVEFGTGPNGEANHKGISPEVAVAYRQSGWMIPVKASGEDSKGMTEEDAEAYGLLAARDSEGNVIGFYTKGQAAHPYMYPALANKKENIMQIYRQYVQRKIEDLKE